MAKQTKQRETFDCVQWDGLKETALAFFGMDVLDHDRMLCLNKDFYFDEGNNLLLFIVGEQEGVQVDIGEWLLKDEDGKCWPESDKDFNNEYEIIDECPA